MANENLFKSNEYEMYTHFHWLKGQEDTKGWTNTFRRVTSCYLRDMQVLHFLWNSKVLGHVHKSPPLSQINPVHTSYPVSIKIYSF
jgi:hypothetical protein